jgi:RNA polymerase sigma factor (sigma-70 family)
MGQPNWTPLDEHRFEAGLAKTIPSLQLLARRLERSDADGDEALQETLERAWRNRRQLRSLSALEPWLRKILIRQVAETLRAELAHSLQSIDDHEPVLPDVADPAAVVERAADEKGLRQALRRLSAADRLAIVLHDGEGWTAKEVAEVLGVGEQAAHKRIQRARGRLVAVLAAGTPQVTVGEEGCRPFRRLALELLDGRLGAVEAAAVEDHLGECPNCPAALQAAIGVWEALAQQPLQAVGAPLRAKLTALIEEGAGAP